MDRFGSIKEIRRLTGLGLLEAKNALDAHGDVATILEKMFPGRPMSQVDISLRSGTCPDCQAKLLGPAIGAERPGEKALCVPCNTRWVLPHGTSPGHRWDDDDTPPLPKPIPLDIPGQGSIIPARGDHFFGGHNCSSYNPGGLEHNTAVELHHVGDHAVLLCRGCGMRVKVPKSVRTWEDLVEHWSDRSKGEQQGSHNHRNRNVR
jgi:hypothetical protein